MKLNLTNYRYEKLVAIKPTNKKQGTNIIWLCKCDCGNYTEVATKHWGVNKSCGCLRKPHNMSRTSFYKVWSGMKARCNNPNTNKYELYGGKGIKVDKRWNKFENFKADVYRGYLEHIKKYGKNNTTIDRKNSNKNYNKSNCRWATYKTQGNNTSRNVYIYYLGKTKTISQWAIELNINRWSVEKFINNNKHYLP